MDSAGLLALIYNAALLLVMILIYDLTSRHKQNNISVLWQCIAGISLGLVALLIMLTPWQYEPGVVFDTRSVLLGITGLFFGGLTTIIAVLIAVAIRIYLGGIAVMTGILVIMGSGALGLIWRYFRQGDLASIRWRELYLFGIALHVMMLLLMLTLPLEKALIIIATVSTPVLIIYPFTTMLLGKLLAKRLIHETLNDNLTASQQIIWQKTHLDPLTNLPNRYMFVNHLNHAIQTAEHHNHVFALLFLDLDLFKEVNDTLGHNLGDRLLQQVGQRLQECLSNNDVLARLGGDEFMILLPSISEQYNASHVAECILRRLTEPFLLDDEVIYISCSIGISLYPDDAKTAELLLKNVDQAMYAAKNDGRNRYHYFTAAMQETAQRRMRVISDLRTALTEQQLVVYYQPIVNLTTGEVTKAEALIRWQHPVRGLIAPAEFIPLAEQTGMICDIGNWVFQEVAQQVASWRSQYNIELQVSINKSPIQFRDDNDTFNKWYAYLQQLKLSSNAIAIEITEGLLLDASPKVQKVLLNYRNAGIQVSLDDFGTGYSSLAYLKKFSIDYVKIDQSFTKNLCPDSDDLALCEAIIVMAHKLNIAVIAEGVETVKQRQLLVAAGCDYAQGYLYSKPVPADEFARLFLTHTN